jgi:hypothetical protein
MKKIFIVFGLFLLIQPIFSQKCTSIVTPDGELSVKKGLTLYWDIMTKDTLSKRGRIIYTRFSSSEKITEDTVKSIFIVEHIGIHLKGYQRIDDKIKNKIVYKIWVRELNSNRRFVILSTRKYIFKGKKIRIGKSLYLSIVPLTEFDYSETFYGSTLYCITFNNIYIYKYNGPIGIAISPNLHGIFYIQ